MKVRYTVPSDQSRVGYSTNGSTTVFSVPFVFFDDTDLQVILVNNTTAVETVLTLTTNYTVTGGAGTTGSLTTVSTYASGSTLVIQREIPYTQEIDYQANDGFPADVNEEGLDRSTMQVQQVRRRARQTPQLPATYDPESGDISFPMPEAGKTLVANAGETGWDNADIPTAGTNLPTALVGLANYNLLEYDSASVLWRNQTLLTVLGRLLTTQGDMLRRGVSGVERFANGTAGQVLGTGPVWITPSIKLTVFTATGTWTVDNNMRQAFIFALGGGGGGGGSATSAVSSLGAGGGGAGSWALKLTDKVTAGTTQGVTIGAAGAGGTAGDNNGSAGTDTSIGTLCVGKGGAGGLGTGVKYVGTGGLGGVAGTGDLTPTGTRGTSGVGMAAASSVVATGGNGASSIMGGGGLGPAQNTGTTSAAGGVATGYGAGGGGAANSADNTNNRAGGAGTAGLAFIVEIVRP